VPDGCQYRCHLEQHVDANEKRWTNDGNERSIKNVTRLPVPLLIVFLQVVARISFVVGSGSELLPLVMTSWASPVSRASGVQDSINSQAARIDRNHKLPLSTSSTTTLDIQRPQSRLFTMAASLASCLFCKIVKGEL